MRFRICLALLLVGSLFGCAAVSDLTGAAAGLAAGAATANPAVGIGVGIAVRAGTAESLRRVALIRQQDEQDAISAAAADARPGEARRWSIEHRLGGDRHGEVRVIRVIETPLAVCKEVAFSVLPENDTGASPEWFTTIACQEHGTWKWATAEPAVERWLNLQ